MSQPPMSVRVRRHAGVEPRFSLQFQVAQGHGLLSRLSPREDPAPGPMGEAQEVDAQRLRGGRFVHIGKNGRRLGYSFARLTPDRLAVLPESEWVELEPTTEYGIRYLVVGAEHKSTSRAEESLRAQVTIPPTNRRVVPRAEVDQAKATVRIPSASSAAEAGEEAASPPGTPPAPVARVRARPESTAPPPSVAGQLMEAAVSGLSRRRASELLRRELERTAALESKLERLQERLAASEARERDLLEVLKRWQGRASAAEAD